MALTNQTTIWRWEPGSDPEVWLDDTEAGTNGHAINNAGKLIAARQLDGSLVEIDWETKELTTIVDEYEDKRFNSPNDLTIASDGTIYFTDPNWNTPSNVDTDTVQGGGDPGDMDTEGQRIYRVDPEAGTVVDLGVTDDDMVPDLRDKPNGIILSEDESQILIGGLRGLWAFDLEDGEVSNPEQLLDTAIDGLGRDCAGNIYVTTTREIEGRDDGQIIAIFDKNNEEVGFLEVPGIHITTNVAFGGDDGRTLFVTGLTAPTADPDEDDPDFGSDDYDPGPRQCGDDDCLPAGIYEVELNVQGYPY
jgi:gluconolactonase